MQATACAHTYPGPEHACVGAAAKSVACLGPPTFLAEHVLYGVGHTRGLVVDNELEAFGGNERYRVCVFAAVFGHPAVLLSVSMPSLFNVAPASPIADEHVTCTVSSSVTDGREGISRPAVGTRLCSESSVIACAVTWMEADTLAKVAEHADVFCFLLLLMHAYDEGARFRHQLFSSLQHSNFTRQASAQSTHSNNQLMRRQ